MRTIDNTASADDTGAVMLDNGWSAKPVHGAVYVYRPGEGDNRGELAGMFDSFEEGLGWAASGGAADPANGIRFRPS